MVHIYYLVPCTRFPSGSAALNEVYLRFFLGIKKIIEKNVKKLWHSIRHRKKLSIFDKSFSKEVKIEQF
jgi:hypothetical protein